MTEHRMFQNHCKTCEDIEVRDLVRARPYNPVKHKSQRKQQHFIWKKRFSISVRDWG